MLDVQHFHPGLGEGRVRIDWLIWAEGGSGGGLNLVFFSLPFS